MIDISDDQLATVIGAGMPGRGMAIPGRIGWYEQVKNIRGMLHRRLISPKGKRGPWRPYHPTYPDYEGQ